MKRLSVDKRLLKTSVLVALFCASLSSFKLNSENENPVFRIAGSSFSLSHDHPMRGFFEDWHDAIGLNATVMTEVDTSVVVDVTTLDSSIGDNPFCIEVLAGPIHGSSFINPTSGEITYTPDPGYVGEDVFCYRVCQDLCHKVTDATPCEKALVKVIVEQSVGTRHSPTCRFSYSLEDACQVSCNEKITICYTIKNTSGKDVGCDIECKRGIVIHGLVPKGLDYKFDSTRHPSTTIGEFNPKTGTWTLPGLFAGQEETLKVTYIVDPKACEIDQVIKIDFCGFGKKESVLHIPVGTCLIAAVDDCAETKAGVPVVIEVLKNDISPTSPLDPSSLEIIAEPLHGQVVPNKISGEVLYTPDPGFVGTDVFRYRICNFLDLCDSAKVTVEVCDRKHDHKDPCVFKYEFGRPHNVYGIVCDHTKKVECHEEVVLCYTVKNTCRKPLSGLKACRLVPYGLQYLEDSTFGHGRTKGVYDPDDCTWSLDTLGPNEEQVLDILCRVDPHAGGHAITGCCILRDHKYEKCVPIEIWVKDCECDDDCKRQPCLDVDCKVRHHGLDKDCKEDEVFYHVDICNEGCADAPWVVIKIKDIPPVLDIDEKSLPHGAHYDSRKRSIWFPKISLDCGECCGFDFKAHILDKKTSSCCVCLKVCAQTYEKGDDKECCKPCFSLDRKCHDKPHDDCEKKPCLDVDCKVRHHGIDSSCKKDEVFYHIEVCNEGCQDAPWVVMKIKDIPDVLKIDEDSLPHGAIYDRHKRSIWLPKKSLDCSECCDFDFKAWILDKKHDHCCVCLKICAQTYDGGDDKECCKPCFCLGGKCPDKPHDDCEKKPCLDVACKVRHHGVDKDCKKDEVFYHIKVCNEGCANAPWVVIKIKDIPSVLDIDDDSLPHDAIYDRHKGSIWLPKKSLDCGECCDFDFKARILDKKEADCCVCLKVCAQTYDGGEDKECCTPCFSLGRKCPDKPHEDCEKKPCLDVDCKVRHHGVDKDCKKDEVFYHIEVCNEGCANAPWVVIKIKDIPYVLDIDDESLPHGAVYDKHQRIIWLPKKSLDCGECCDFDFKAHVNNEKGSCCICLKVCAQTYESGDDKECCKPCFCVPERYSGHNGEHEHGVECCPQACDDAASTYVNTPVDINVAANDKDLDDPKFFVIQDPQYGEVTGGQDGIFTYTPDDGFFGLDEFVYKVCNYKHECCDTARVLICVVQHEAPKGKPCLNVRCRVHHYDNDADCRRDEVIFKVKVCNNGCGLAPHVVVKAVDVPPCVEIDERVLPHGCIYDPHVHELTLPPKSLEPGECCDFIFKGRIKDVDHDACCCVRFVAKTHYDCPEIDCCLACFAIPQCAPKAHDDVVSTLQNKPIEIDVSLNDKNLIDPQFTLLKDASHGQVAGGEDGIFIYKPDRRFIGLDCFTYKVCNKEPWCCDTAKVWICVVPCDIPEKRPCLDLDFDVKNGQINPGCCEEIEYEIWVCNNGCGDATCVEVQVKNIPRALTIIEECLPYGATFDSCDGTITFSKEIFGNINIDECKHTSFKARVDAPFEGGVICLDACLTFAEIDDIWVESACIVVDKCVVRG